ncbi:SDR family NAD(P)-dependent oxidoreductase [Embleya sp. AB8]|uniref:SDR family NAD(P)-dependent oxidoreductase n=1 Tax=Embleya sp. AB8 TaxID=3156304 RepID=UPI003C78449B
MSDEPGVGNGWDRDEEPVAIVGIGLRLPGGAESPDDFDEFLRAGRSGIRTIPEDRWDVEALRARTPDERGRIATHSGGFLDRVDLFDAPFFNISPKEARYVDPQQRMVLETAWQALEHAGIDPTPLRRGDGGVFMGVSSFDWALHVAGLPFEELDGHLAAGCTMFSISGRVSYFLGWRGPSMCVDTACSSSLSALHLAVRALRGGECSIALTGGVNALHHPNFMVMFSHGQMLSEDGRCKAFDESADGYARAEGCGVLVLKRVSDALRDGDTVHALIRGTAIGQDGDSAGLTVPHGPSQEAVIHSALAAARLSPADIQYVEAHGTGTPLGDPIELGAINAVFAKSHADEPLVVGSAKTNVGHLEPAAGIVGVIKTVLQLRSATIYPHLNFTEPARRIPWDQYPVVVPTKCLPWRAPVRRAVVNSFGFAGTIAATVLEQAPPVQEAQPAEPGFGVGVFTLSGKNAAGLRRQAESYRAFVAAHPDVDPERLCHTTNVGRAHLTHRLAGVVGNRKDVVRLLDAALEPDDRPAPPAVRKVAFLFGGQGAQYAGMGAALYERFPVFRAELDACEELFAPRASTSVRDLILGRAEDPALLDRTEFTQPALFAFEVALARLWMSWGVQPNVVIGHSIGEVSAAAVAGLFSLPDAVTLVAARARLMQSVRKPGAMAAVALPAEEVLALLEGRVDLALAAVNAPDQCVVSGAAEQLDVLVAELRERGARVDALAVSHAFHSPLMTEVFDEFRAALADITFRPPEIPLISNVTGALAKFAELGRADYWVRHIGEPVLFMSGVRAVEQRGRHAFVEIGPSTALTALAKRSVTAEEHRWAASVRRRDPRGDTALRGLAELYTAGIAVDWRGVHAGRRSTRIPLPTYAFERKRYWLPVTGPTGAGASGPAQGAGWHPLLGRPVPALEGDPEGTRRFVATCTAEHPACLAGHVGPNGPELPAAAYVELMLALRDLVYGDSHGAVHDLVVSHEALPLSEETPVELRTRLIPAADGGSRVEVVAGPVADERVYATAFLADPADVRGPDAALRASADRPGPIQESVAAEDVYTDLASVGRRHGPGHRRLTRVVRHAGATVTAELTGRDGGTLEHVPVEVVTAALQAAVAADAYSPAFVATRFGEIRLFRKPRGELLRVVARVAGSGPEERLADLLILDGDAPVLELRGVHLTRPEPADRRPEFLHRLSWLRRRIDSRPDREAAPRHVVVLGADHERLAATGRAAGARLSHPKGPEELAAALGDATVTDVCWFWQPGQGAMSAERLRRECARNYTDLLALVAALTGAGPHVAPRLWLITERAQWLAGDRPDTGENLPAATLWGFGHVLLNEYPRYRATLVDLPAGADPGLLAQEWTAADVGDFQIAHRDGHRYVRRLLPGARTPAWDGGFALQAVESNASSELRPVPAEAGPPGPGEVLVRVHAAAVHHRDLRRRNPDTGPAAAEDAPVPGWGCSGTVIAAGPDAGPAVGDRVVVHHRGTARHTVTVPAAAAAVVCSGLSLDVAAGLPAAYLAARVALDAVADVAAGALVLVHAGGGIGQALTALAIGAGHEVITTAEPDARNRVATSARPGTHRVLAPDTPDLAAEVLKLTDGQGVDVAFVDPSPGRVSIGVECLVEGGRYVLLGTDPHPSGDTAAGAAADASADPGGPARVSHRWADPGALDDATRAALVAEVLPAVVEAVRAGELPPIRVEVFDLDEADEALAASRAGIGAQPVVRMLPTGADAPEAADAPGEFAGLDAPGRCGSGPEPTATRTRLDPAAAPIAEPANPVRPDRAYLISGGLGGLGLVTATKLADLGARHLILVGRSGVPTEEAVPILRELAEQTEVTVVRADLGDADDVARLFTEVRAGGVPLGGIVHAAGSAGAGLIGTLSWPDIDAQLRAQAYGGWLLHEAALDCPDLDFFVVHSSIAAVVGGSTQSHYAAAFAFLDGLITWRARQGLPGRSVNWGMWSRVGMSARLDEKVARELERGGLRFFSPARALRTLGRLLPAPEQRYVGGEWDWARYQAASPLRNALYSRVANPQAHDADAERAVGRSGLDPAALLAKPRPERLAELGREVLTRVVAALHADEGEEIDPSTEFVSLGLDSLMALELRTGLEKLLRIPLPASIAFDFPTPHLLTEFLDAQLVPATD